MPTGIEEAVAAVAAQIAEFVAAGAALSPFSGPPDPGGAARAAGGSAAVADDPIVAPAVSEGTSDVAAPAVPSPVDGALGEGGAAPMPTTGDHPAPETGHRPAATVVRGDVRERHDGNVTTFEYTDQFVVDVPREPAPAQEAAPPVPEDADPAATAPPPLPPASAPPPAWQPAFAPAGGGWTPPLATDVGGGGSAPPPLVPDPGSPPETAPGGIPVAADIAAQMEQDSKNWNPRGLVWAVTPMAPLILQGWLLRNLLGMSSEDIGQWARDRVSDFLSWRIRATPELSSRNATQTAAGATIVATVSELGIGMATTMLDPEMAARGIMRIGAASPEGLRKIEEGDKARGGAVIAGEIGTALLVVLPAAAAVESLGASAGTPGVTVYANRFNPLSKNLLGEVTGHNIVSVTEAGGQTTTAHVVGATPANMAEMNRPWPTDFPQGTPLAAQPLRYAGNPLDKGYVGYTRAASAEAARQAYTTMMRSLNEFRNGSIGGPLGPYNLISESCSTYASTIANEAGSAISGRMGPLMTHFQFKYIGTIEGAKVLAGLSLPGILQPAVTQGANPPAAAAPAGP